MPIGLILVFVNNFKSLVIKHFTDNNGVVAILGKGSKHPKLQTLVKKIFLSLHLYEIVMVPVWLSREHEVIQYADRRSKDFKYDDFGLTQDCLGTIKQNFPTLTADAFVQYFSRLLTLWVLLGLISLASTFPPLSFTTSVHPF